MAIGAPGKESFERAIIACRNQHIAAGLAPLIVFRQELVSNDEFKDRGGMDNTTQRHFLAHLLNCDRIRRKVTYNPSGRDLKEIVARGVNPLGSIEADHEPGTAAAGDEVQAQAGREFPIPWALDGSDPNLPLLSQLALVSPTGILLLNAVDIAIVQWTRLESRNQSRFITVMDSLRVYANYQQVWEFLMTFGGDANRVDISNVLPSEEPLGPGSAANRVAEPMAGQTTGRTN